MLSTPLEWAEDRLKKKLSEAFYKGWKKDELKNQLSEKLYKGSLYIEGGFALPKDIFDLLTDFTWNLFSRSYGGFFLEVLRPTELDPDEEEWIREQERLHESKESNDGSFCPAPWHYWPGV